MSKEYLEALNDLFDLVTCQGSFEKAQRCFDIVESALQRLESIDNAEPSEALDRLEGLGFGLWNEDKSIVSINGYYFKNAYDTIKQYILKAQEQEKENELLKEIIKRG